MKAAAHNPTSRQNSTNSVGSRSIKRRTKCTSAAAPGDCASSCSSQNANDNRHGLLPTNVFVRIRPLAESGGHANASNDDGGTEKVVVAKALESWSHDTVTLTTQYLFSKGNSTYTFPKRVLGPQVTQEEAYADMELPSLVDQFTAFGGRNVVMFAYGQTGSGKTHTMFGTDASLDLSNAKPVADDGGERERGWGIFPRVFDATVKRMRAASDNYGRPYVLSASAIEFYLGGCSDLLNPGAAAVGIDLDTHVPIGATVRDVNGTDDLLAIITAVRANRTTRATRMNDGSSRSHAAIILYLRQIDADAGTYCQTSFTIVDLAGAERPGKTKERRFTSADMILWEMSRGKEVPTGAQAYIVNWELSCIATEIRRATEAHERNARYAPPRQLATDATRFLGSCFDGTAVTSMCLCLSPANVNGWETWFSLQYGESVSKLGVPVRRQRPVRIDRAYECSRKEARRAAEELRAAPQNKYYGQRESRAAAAERSANDLEAMMKKVSSLKLSG